MNELEQRLQRIEDVEAVRLLMARYHQACDGWDEAGTHRDPQAIADLFTDDGLWDVTARQPPPVGRVEIADLARELQAIAWIVHVVVNPIVAVDGDEATGEFKGILRVKLTATARLGWSMGLYRIRARRTADGWRIRSMTWEPMTDRQRYDPAASAERKADA